MPSNRNQSQILLIAGAIGALVGLAAGYTLLKRAEERNGQPALTAREGVSLACWCWACCARWPNWGMGNNSCLTFPFFVVEY